MPERSPENLLNLPALPGSGEVEEMVFDGEVVEEAAPGPSHPPVPVRAAGGHAQRHARAAARHLGYVAAGAVVAYRRRKQGSTLAQQMARQLAQQGDHEKALAVLAHDAEQRHKRHDRWQRRIGTAMALIRNWRPVTFVTAGGMLALGIATGDPAGPFRAAAELARFTEDALRVGVIAAPAVTLAALHETGRRAGGLAPGWSIAAKPGGEDRGLVVTADGIVQALQHTPVSRLQKAIKDGWKPSFQLTPVRDGEGYAAVFSTPMGVTANDIADQVEVFARNLHRAKCEVWVTDAERAKIAPAGFVSLWVANPGVLDRPAPEYPLMHEGQADVFKGVPGGVVARGDGTRIPVVANNLVLGGQMGMGKSNAGRVFILGCATDPLCELNVFVFAGNGDFDAYAPRLATYVKGADDATVEAATQHLHDLLDEVGRREGRLAELGAKKLTRRIAEQHPDMRPSVSLFSECHELFGSESLVSAGGKEKYGELAAELAVKVIKRARKTGIVLAFDTQSSRAAAIPPALVELVSVNVCFYVKTWRSNDGFLGDGSFQAGIRATELRPGRDIGRSVVTGISDAQFELLKWYYVEVDDDTGWDAATEVIARCMRELAPGTRVSGGDGASLPVITVRDLLDDLRTVVDGSERVKLRDAAGLLRKVDGLYPRYRQMTAAQLREDLAAEGVKTVNASGTLYLDPGQLRLVLAGRGE